MEKYILKTVSSQEFVLNIRSHDGCGMPIKHKKLDTTSNQTIATQFYSLDQAVSYQGKILQLLGIKTVFERVV